MVDKTSSLASSEICKLWMNPDEMNIHVQERIYDICTEERTISMFLNSWLQLSQLGFPLTCPVKKQWHTVDSTNCPSTSLEKKLWLCICGDICSLHAHPRVATLHRILGLVLRKPADSIGS